MSIRARSLGEILVGRIAFFAVLAMLAQVAIVFGNYYWNDGELSRLLIERETEQLAGGISGPSEQLFFALPDDLKGRYGSANSGYFARIRTTSGQVLFSTCNEQCATHFMPLDLKPPSFWIRTIRPGKPLTLAGGRAFTVADDTVLVEVAIIGDPQDAISGVLWREVLDHMIVPMGIILVLVFGATLVSVRTALRPVRAAALAADALDPMDSRSHLNIEGMPLEVARLADAVNRAFTRVGDLMKAQKILTSGIAHEVRTPLAAVKLELERIDHPRARKAEADLDELVNFVEQLTSLARLDTFDHSLFQPVSLSAIGEDVVQAMAPWVYQNGHSLALEKMGDRQVLALESLLRDAVRNLVENAVKHTPAGSAIVVSVDNSTIAVRDQAAIAKVDVVATTASKSAGGLGIGLEIVRRIAALHGAQFEMVRDNSGTLARLVFDARRAG